MLVDLSVDSVCDSETGVVLVGLSVDSVCDGETGVVLVGLRVDSVSDSETGYWVSECLQGLDKLRVC